ncbi:MAG: hypothetical protein M1320_02795 [Patescibacteria group bacterium]|nr:hypothetical protein [Patescibacteria group bacterium]
MNYTFKITQLKEYTIEVVASNRDEALEKANEEMKDIELGIVENKGNIIDTNIDEVSVEEPLPDEENDDEDSDHNGVTLTPDL